MKNKDNLDSKKEKKVNKIKEQLARLRAKLESENKHPSFPPKSKFKKTKDEAKQAEAPKKVKEAKEKKAGRKEEAKKKAKEAKEKEEEAKKIAKEKEEEAKRTYEEELEEHLTEEEITDIQLEKTDMDKMCNRVCENIAGYESDGILQSQLWKKYKLSSRDGSRLALKLERMGMITREKILEKERWTYKLIIKKSPISTKSIEGSPCLTCPVEAKCSLDGEVSPKTCQWIENWVMIELKNK